MRRALQNNRPDDDDDDVRRPSLPQSCVRDRSSRTRPASSEDNNKLHVVVAPSVCVRARNDQFWLSYQSSKTRLLLLFKKVVCRAVNQLDVSLMMMMMMMRKLLVVCKNVEEKGWCCCFGKQLVFVCKAI